MSETRPPHHPTPLVIVHKDPFTLVTTLLAAALNLTSVLLVLFGVMGKIDREIDHVKDGQRATEALREEAVKNRDRIEVTRDTVRRVRVEVERQREAMEKLAEALKAKQDKDEGCDR